MQKFLFVILFLWCTEFLDAQFLCDSNLVPNGSFEDTLQCPADQAQISYAVGWVSPTINTPDYFNGCYSGSSITPVGVPQNFEGYQTPVHGSAYAGFASYYSAPNGREYVSTQLSDTLVANKRYCVSFYISLSDSSMFAVNQIGAYFSTTALSSGNIFTLHFLPQVESSGDTILNNKNDWTKISGSFIATGGERFITIGTFQDDSALVIDTLSGSWWNAYYYIDVVSVCACDTPETVYLGYLLYPNPSNGEFTITGNFPEHTQLFVYDMLGQKVMESPYLPVGNNSVPVHLQLSQGVYYYELRSTETLATGKLMIVK
jgi:hypothetical protein